jgi:hypothetical protein
MRSHYEQSGGSTEGKGYMTAAWIYQQEVIRDYKYTEYHIHIPYTIHPIQSIYYSILYYTIILPICKDLLTDKTVVLKDDTLHPHPQRKRTNTSLFQVPVD